MGIPSIIIFYRVSKYIIPFKMDFIRPKSVSFIFMLFLEKSVVDLYK